MTTHARLTGATARWPDHPGQPGHTQTGAAPAQGKAWGRARHSRGLLTMLTVLGLSCLTLAGCATRDNRAADDADAVIEWTMLADEFGGGGANWRTIAIMHRAMHDAINAARPVYARWSPPAPGEPAANGAAPEIAMAAAARQTLLLLHLERRAETERHFQAALARSADGPAKEAGIRLGTAIGTAAVRRRDNDGAALIAYFASSGLPMRWRPTPAGFGTGRTEGTVPFLFAAVSDVPAVPPPAPDSPVWLQHLDEVRRVGAARNAQRTRDQTASAIFWAGQNSQRGFVHLAGHLLVAHPRAGGLAEHAWIMARLTSALADSGIIVWNEKARFAFWRPVTAIRAAAGASDADRNWEPLVETPPFPEYPSGHAADCYVGAGMLRAAFPDLREPVSYPWHVGSEAPHVEAGTEHHRMNGQEEPHRLFASLDAAADECALSRIWAGVHFRAGDEEAKRLADIIVKRALTTVPPLSLK